MSEQWSKRTFNRRQMLKTTGLAAAGLTLAACGGSSTSGGGKTELTFALYTVSPKWNADFTRMIQTFNRSHQSIHVNVDFRPALDYFTKLQTQFAAGRAPDITCTDLDWTVPGASRGMFVDLKPLMQRDGIDQRDYWYPFGREWSYKNGIYAVLEYAGGQATYVNKALLKAAGLSFPADNWTWDDLLEYARKLTDPSKGQYGVSLFPVNPPYWSSSFIQANGGSVLNAALDKCTLDSPRSMEALQYIHDLIFKEKVMPTPPPPNMAATSPNPFMTGKVGIYFGGTWDEVQIRASGFDWDYAHMPADPHTGKRSVQGASNGWAMLSTTKHRDAAWEVLKFLVTRPGQTAMMADGLPVRKDLIGTRDYLELHAPQHIDVLVQDLAKYGHGYYGTPDATQWWNAVDQQLSPAWSGDKSLDQAVQATVSAVDAVFAQRKG